MPKTATQQAQTVRINVSLPKETYETLKELAGRYGLDMTRFVRNALQVYNFLLTQQKEGKKVYIGTDDRIERELLLPGADW